MCVGPPGKLNVNDEELDGMLNEGKGPINFTVFVTLFGEKLNGENVVEMLFQYYSIPLCLYLQLTASSALFSVLELCN